MRKKINIFILATIIVGTAILWRTTFICNGEVLEKVLYKSDNIIIRQVQEGNEHLVILGTGYSLSIDEQNKVIKHDPLMVETNIEFEEETVMEILYPFESIGLEQAGKELSVFINSIIHEYESITLIGHSKCGVCFANAVKWIEFDNVNIVTDATPFKGTPIADKDEVLERLNWLEKGIYTLIFSNHVVDQDIMPNSNFIKNADYSGLENCTHINIVSECPTSSINPIDRILIHFDKVIGIRGDGIVPKASQQALSYSNTIEREIEATHATSMKMGVMIAKEILKETEGSGIELSVS